MTSEDNERTVRVSTDSRFVEALQCEFMLRVQREYFDRLFQVEYLEFRCHRSGPMEGCTGDAPGLISNACATRRHRWPGVPDKVTMVRRDKILQNWALLSRLVSYRKDLSQATAFLALSGHRIE